MKSKATTWIARGALLVLPFVVVAVGSRRLAVRWGDALARATHDVIGAPPPAPGSAPPPPAPGADEAVDAGAPATDVDAGGARRSPAPGGRISDAGARDDGGPLAFHLKAETVDRVLAKYGKNLRGRTERDATGRPIGVRLTGITPAGVGLQDGDRIVAVEGQPTMDDDTATEVLLGAIARGKTTVHARLVRGERPIDVTVDVPLEQLGGAEGGR